MSWTVPTGEEVLKFFYHSIEIGDLSPDDIRNLREVSFLPFLPLTQGGATRQIVGEMITELNTLEHKPLALLGYTLASLVFKRKSPADLEWLIRSFKEMHDILRDTPIYQIILEEGFEKGLEQGLEKAHEEEKLNLRLLLANIVQGRSPELANLAKECAARIEDLQVLRQIVMRLGIIEDEDKIRRYLMTLDDN